jgi:tetratricopeptide (TPR) repeat protein
MSNSNQNEKINKDLEGVQKLFFEKKIDLSMNKINKVIKKNKNNYLPYNYRGIILLELKNYRDAISDFKKTLLLNPNFTDAYCNLGIGYKSLGNYEKAIESYKLAYKLNNNFLEAKLNLGGLYYELGKYREAIAEYRDVLDKNKNIEHAHQLIADALIKEIKHDVATDHHIKAISINPKNPINFFLLGADYIYTGDKNLAAENFKKALILDPKYCAAYYGLSKVQKISLSDPVVQQIKKLLIDKTVLSSDKVYLNFTMAKIHESNDDDEQFFEYLTIGNKLRNQESKFDIGKTKNQITIIKNIFKNKIFKNKKLIEQFKEKIEICPIFIVGMPRSGTSLIEQILSNNDIVFGAGELDTIHEFLLKLVSSESSEIQLIDGLNVLKKNYLERLEYITDKKIIIDKLPLNFYWIGFIKTIFPNAKIIHIKRDPIAINFSIYKNLFEEGAIEFSYDEDDIINFYKFYEELMQFWNEIYSEEILNIDYDLLVNNPAIEAKKIFKFTNVDFNSNYLKIENNSRAVTTASDLQIRNKIYKGSSENWKKYKKYLKKFIDAFQ